MSKKKKDCFNKNFYFKKKIPLTKTCFLNQDYFLLHFFLNKNNFLAKYKCFSWNIFIIAVIFIYTCL